MTEEQINGFLLAVKADSTLQMKLNAAANAETLLAIAKEAGFLISVEGLVRAQAELSDEELENMQGGTFFKPKTQHRLSTHC